jgi:hypothetical protein
MLSAGYEEQQQRAVLHREQSIVAREATETDTVTHFGTRLRGS